MRRVPANSTLMTLLTLPAGGTYGDEIASASYTLEHDDNGCDLFLPSNQPQTVLLPAELLPGFTCRVWQDGAGQVSFTAASGATMHTLNDASAISGRYGAVRATVRSNDNGAQADWRSSGDLVTAP